MGTITFRKLFSAFLLTSLVTLSAGAEAAGGHDRVVNIAAGRNYLALSSEEISKAMQTMSPEDARAALQDKANQRADELCAARGFQRVASCPVLGYALADAAIGPWADDFADIDNPESILQNTYRDVTLTVVKNPTVVPHRLFFKLNCGTELQEPAPMQNIGLQGYFVAG